MVVLAILGVIGVAFLGSSVLPRGRGYATSPGGATPDEAQVTEVVAAKVPDDVELDDVFTYRDVFVPTVVLVSTTDDDRE